ncbi:MAG: hypothetical protein HRU38_04820 [Saccharospirillaceae bacterium]|nr:hypothetical protein [Pseudomonadales bacterium]NRB77979.1 hypothetical protein [Saccharospirillaceae bacterium]
MSNKEKIQVQSPAQLQGSCIVCANTSGLSPHSFSLKYFKPVNYLWLLIACVPTMLTTPSNKVLLALACVPFLIAFLVSRKKLIIETSICTICEKRHGLWKKIGLIAVIVMLINFVIGFNLEVKPLLLLNTITISTIILSLMAYHKVRHGLRITGFDNDVFSVEGFSKSVLSIINNPNNN